MTLIKKSITCIDTILHWFADQFQLQDTEYIKFETAKYYTLLPSNGSILLFQTLFKLIHIAQYYCHYKDIFNSQDTVHITHSICTEYGL